MKKISLKTFALSLTLLVMPSLSQAQSLMCQNLLRANNNFTNLPLSQNQPKELNPFFKGSLRRFLGSKFISIKASNLTELADEMLQDKKRYDLVFKGEKGFFTDLGIFDLLNEHPASLTLPVDSKRTVHVLPLQAGGVLIFLKNKTSNGEELSFVGSQMVTGALLKWLEAHETVKFKELMTLARQLPKAKIDMSLDNLGAYSTDKMLKALNSLSKIHALTDNKDLELSMELATFFIKLQVLSRSSNYSEEDVVNFYKETKNELGFWGEEAQILALTFFGLLSEIPPATAKRLFDKSGGFWSDTSDSLAVFTGIASNIKMDKLNGKLPEGEVTMSTLEDYIEKHRGLYKEAQNTTGFFTDNSVYTYISSAISYNETVSIEELEERARKANKDAKGDADGPLLILASSLGKDIEDVITDFNLIYEKTKDNEVALALLEASYAPNQNLDTVMQLFDTASFKGEGIDSDEVSSLLATATSANMRPGIALSLVKEASTYTGNKLSAVELTPFVESVIGADLLKAENMSAEMSRFVREQIAEEIRRQTVNNIIVLVTVINVNTTVSAGN